MPTLNWLTREADLQKNRRAPYRLLEPDPEMGYGDSTSGNLLILVPVGPQLVDEDRRVEEKDPIPDGPRTDAFLRGPASTS